MADENAVLRRYLQRPHSSYSPSTAYPETDSLYIELSNRPSVRPLEAAPGVVLDIDADGNLVGIDVDRASRIADLSRLEAQSLPLATLLVAPCQAQRPAAGP